jgi:DNA-binding MarR family transcriptional regulator
MTESAEPTDNPAPKDHLVSWLMGRVVSMVRSNDPDLSLRQLGVLLICRTTDAPQTVRGLAEALGTHKPAVTRATDALEKYKLARRLPDPRDNRSILIEVTQDGRALCRRLGRQTDAPSYL